MLSWIAVAAGGAVGCVARHGVNRLVHQQWPFMTFPLATTSPSQVVGGLGGVDVGLVLAERLGHSPAA